MLSFSNQPIHLKNVIEVIKVTRLLATGLQRFRCYSNTFTDTQQILK